MVGKATVCAKKAEPVFFYYYLVTIYVTHNIVWQPMTTVELGLQFFRTGQLCIYTKPNASPRSSSFETWLKQPQNHHTAAE